MTLFSEHAINFQKIGLNVQNLRNYKHFNTYFSTCKQITQSEPTEFSNNGVFHSKGVVIAFSNCLKLNANPTQHGGHAVLYSETNFGTL